MKEEEINEKVTDENIPKLTKKELIEILQNHINRIEQMSVDMMLIPVNHADLMSILLLLSASLHLED